MQAAQKMFQTGNIHWLPLIRSLGKAQCFPDGPQRETYEQLIAILRQRNMISPASGARQYAIFNQGENCLQLGGKEGASFTLTSKLEASKLFLELWYYLDRCDCQVSGLQLCVYNTERKCWIEINPDLIPVRRDYDPYRFLGDTALEEKVCIRKAAQESHPKKWLSFYGSGFDKTARSH